MPHSRIKVNIVTGFLGAGKTTLIQHLLNQRPPGESWAVLVNEFGEVGIDGALLSREGVLVKEIPGGCMCCVNGLPMQISLNMLLARKPHRLIIEPTGLGHPKEILQLLQNPYYAELIELQATLTLIDPRKLGDERYIQNDNFLQQAQVADILVASKSDLCNAEDRERFSAWSKQRQPAPGHTVFVENGQLSAEWLDQPNQHKILDATTEAIHTGTPLFSLTERPTQTLVRKENQGDGFFSYGWRIPANWQFAQANLIGWLHGLPAVRIKGVLHTDKGWQAINGMDFTLKQQPVDGADESRLEMIFAEARDAQALEDALLNARSVDFRSQ